MKKMMRAAMLATVLCSGANAALAGEITSESRSVDARTVKVDVDGVINLKVRQGASASLVLSGDSDELRDVVIEQRGDTLHIGSREQKHSFTFGNKKKALRAELVLPQLAALTSGGVGSTEVNGFNGDKLRLALEGAGSVKLDAQYRNLDVRLGGLGSITVNGGSSEQVDLDLQGAGRIEISGASRSLRARLGGLGSLEAQQMRADLVDVNMSGLGSATLYAKNSANLVLTGLGSATVYGKPATRSASARGLGSVSWQ